jgi:hypothetical protein
MIGAMLSDVAVAVEAAEVAFHVLIAEGLTREALLNGKAQ